MGAPIKAPTPRQMGTCTVRIRGGVLNFMKGRAVARVWIAMNRTLLGKLRKGDMLMLLQVLREIEDTYDGTRQNIKLLEGLEFGKESILDDSCWYMETIVKDKFGVRWNCLHRYYTYKELARDIYFIFNGKEINL